MLKQTLLTLTAFAVIGAGLFTGALWFAGWERGLIEGRENLPRVVLTRPGDGERLVPANASVTFELFFPVAGKMLDRTSLTPDAVTLTDAQTGEVVSARINSTAADDGITLTPNEPLQPGRTYIARLGEGVRDVLGNHFESYESRFTVRPAERVESFPVAYERVEEPAATIEQSAFTVLKLSPDGGELFAATYDGRIFRYAIQPDGMLEPAGVIPTLLAGNGGPRLVTGLAFDPNDPSVLWVSHGQMALERADDWTGKVSTLSGEGFGVYTDRVVGLPRSYKDHLNFNLAFGPDEAIYLSQGSNTGTGAPDPKWNLRPERLLTAAILRIDPAKLPTDGALDVRTDDGGTYNPFAPDAPLTLHATGVRSGYDLLWHSSGRLLSGINGASPGGAIPAVTEGPPPLNPAEFNLPLTTDDILVDLTEPGGYYGHPNPERGELRLNGANPTADIDPQEVPQYLVGTVPEANWQPPVYVFGKGVSPNGLEESRADRFDGRIRGGVFVTRFSAGDDLVLLLPDTSVSGFAVVESYTGIDGLGELRDPLDVVEDPKTGNLYVAEYGGSRLTLLRPVENGVSENVYREVLE